MEGEVDRCRGGKLQQDESSTPAAKGPIDLLLLGTAGLPVMHALSVSMLST